MTTQRVEHTHDVERDERIDVAADQYAVEPRDGMTAMTALDRLVDEAAPRLRRY